MNKYAERAVSLNNLGLIAKDKGDLGQAKEYFEKAFQEMIKAMNAAKDGKADTVYLLDVLRIMDNLGDIFRELGDLKNALIYCKDSTQLAQEYYGQGHPELAKFYNDLGRVLLDLADFDGAEKYFSDALEIDVANLGQINSEVAIRYNNLGTVALSRFDYKMARTYFEKAVAIEEKTIGPDHPEIIHSLVNLSTAMIFGENNKAEALKYLERALDIATKRLGNNHPTTKTIKTDITHIISSLK